jgi:hypothetical protein
MLVHDGWVLLGFVGVCICLGTVLWAVDCSEEHSDTMGGLRAF